MKIVAEQMYRKLSPVERAQLVFDAVARGDADESDRLIHTTPARGESAYRNAHFGLMQAYNAYVELLREIEIGLFAAMAGFLAETRYCMGWLEAGGDFCAPQMVEHEREARRIKPMIDGFNSYAAGLAVGFKQWCEERGVDPEIVLARTGRKLWGTENPDPKAIAEIRILLNAINLT